MTKTENGPGTRRPVYLGTRRVTGLYERTLADGRIVFETMFKADGRVHRRRLTAETKTDAAAELRALRVDFARGDRYRSDALAPTVRDLAADYLEHLEGRIAHRDPARRYSARTVALYRERLTLHVLPTLGHRVAADVTAADLRRLTDQLGALAPGTVTSVLSIVSGMLRYGVKRGAVERNVARDLDRDDRPGVKRETEPRYLDAEQVAALLAEMTETFRPVAATCAYAGLRVSEALGLRWQDVDLKAGTLTVSGQLGADGERVPFLKSASSAATVPLLPALVEELRAHRSREAGRNLARVQPGALVFTTSRGRAQSRRNALRAVQHAADAVGLNGPDLEPVGLHDLRHSFVALAIAAGLSLAEAAVLARHANAKVTATIYAGVADSTRETLAERLAATGFGS